MVPALGLSKLFSKKGIASLVALILVAGAIYWITRDKFISIPSAKLGANGTDAIPKGWDPMPLVQELFDTMNGINFKVEEEENAWRKLAELPTDEMVILVYNNFNQKYFPRSKETLTQWIKDETGAVVFSNKPLALERLDRLKLK